MSMTDTIEAGQMTITGERMNPTGTLIESLGMDVASLMVCTRTQNMFFFLRITPTFLTFPHLDVR